MTFWKTVGATLVGFVIFNTALIFLTAVYTVATFNPLKAIH